MIIVNLIGGLGNQMFQYAFGRAFSVKYNLPLALDTSEFRTYTLRRFELGNLNIHAGNARKIELFLAKKHGHAGRFLRKFLGYRIYRESGFQHQEIRIEPRLTSYFSGYWQSYRYIESIRELLLKEFSLRDPTPEKCLPFASMIESSNSVAIHIRRGDYVSNPETNSYHGTCSEEYYREALQRVKSAIQDPHYFVFSDEIEWCKSNLSIFGPLDRVTFVDCNTSDQGFLDIFLMSKCRAHIIANSSLSWWSAWLAHDRLLEPIAPRKWFNKEDIDTSDLCPPDWIRI